MSEDGHISGAEGHSIVEASHMAIIKVSASRKFRIDGVIDM